MAKIILLSVLIALVVIPVLAARMRNPRRGLKAAIFASFTFIVIYAFAVKFLYPRFVVL